MRIAQIMLAKQFGGGERSFVDLCRALAERGHEILAIVEQRGVALQQLASHTGIECESVHCRGVWDLLCKMRIQRGLARFAPDLVQTHLARASHLAGSAARAHGVPTVAKTHNLVDLKYYRNIDMLVPTTRAQQAYLLEHGVSEASQTLIPNFSALYLATATPMAPDECVIVKSLGRFVHKKGFDVLLRALVMICADGIDVRLEIGGSGPEGRALHALADTLELHDRVSFSGWIEDVPTFLADAQLFILPSRDEPFGIALLEAMARGIPIVATRTTGPLEILSEDLAFFVDADDPARLAATITQAIQHPDDAASRAANAQQRFSDHYHVDKVVACYLDLYARLIG